MYDKRNSKRRDKAETLHRKRVRQVKYAGQAVPTRTAA